MSEELKSCPFCGATNIAFYEGSTFRWMDVQCMECDAHIECRKSDTAKVAEDPVNTLRGIEVWNTRNDRAVIDGFLARVREMAEEETKQLDVDDVQTYWRFYNAMMRVHAEMFEETE